MTLFCVAVIANDDQKPTFSGDSRFSVFFPLLDSNKTTRFFYSKIGWCEGGKVLLALSIVKCLDKTRKYTERNKKKYLLFPFFFFFAWSTDGSDPTESDRWMLSFLARGSEIMSCEELCRHFVKRQGFSIYYVLILTWKIWKKDSVETTFFRFNHFCCNRLKGWVIV